MRTKKDYVKFAEMIAEQQNGVNHVSVNSNDYIFGLQTMLNSIKHELICIFAQNNVNFDVHKFEKHIDKLANQSSD